MLMSPANVIKAFHEIANMYGISSCSKNKFEFVFTNLNKIECHADILNIKYDKDSVKFNFSDENDNELTLIVPLESLPHNEFINVSFFNINNDKENKKLSDYNCIDNSLIKMFLEKLNKLEDFKIKEKSILFIKNDELHEYLRKNHNKNTIFNVDIENISDFFIPLNVQVIKMKRNKEKIYFHNNVILDYPYESDYEGGSEFIGQNAISYKSKKQLNSYKNKVLKKLCNQVHNEYYCKHEQIANIVFDILELDKILDNEINNEIIQNVKKIYRNLKNTKIADIYNIYCTLQETLRYAETLSGKEHIIKTNKQRVTDLLNEIIQ